MTLRRAATALAAGFAAAWAMACLSGCAALTSAAAPPGAAASAAAPTPTPTQRAEYRLDVQAPDELRRLLLNYLDLARFQNAPATEGINADELDRLMRAAPAQARELLETEGYFNATVTLPPVTREGELPLVRVIVEPGPRTTVSAVKLDAVGAIDQTNASGELDALRGAWALPVGAAFRQTAWADAKSLALTRLRADGYAAASWQRTSARVDATTQQVELELVIDSGPLFRIGELRIDGLQRYDESTVRQLTNFAPGDAYSEKLLLDFQERMQKLGLFEGASVELDADPAHADAATVIVHVKEQTQHVATVGIGYSANTGPRVSLEHTNRNLLGWPWVMHNKTELGPQLQTWQGELTSYPKDNLYRNLLSGSATRLSIDDQVLLGWNARIGRTQDTPRIERLYFAELAHTRLDTDLLTTQAEAVSINYHWIYRDLDSVLLPTRGFTTSAQAALGYSHGTLSVLGEPLADTRGPFARLYARLTWYLPFGNAWYGTARVEAGHVFTRDAFGVPDTFLFRAGGDESVRGYAYRTLAPSIDGVTVSARSLFTTSLEIARPISPRYPAYWWAAFVDAGNAADSFKGIRPAVGYGLGLRWRSPVGPLRVDVAYGQQTRQVRTHLSVGIAF
jgi:translocation and assembly module TamA